MKLVQTSLASYRLIVPCDKRFMDYGCTGTSTGDKYEGASSSSLADWVEDAPGEYVYTVIEEWKKGNPTSEDITEVMSFAEGDQ